MNFFRWVSIIVIIICVVCTTDECLHAVDVSTGVLVTGEVLGVTDLSIKVKKVGTNVEQSSVTWANQIVGSGWQMAQSYIELSVECNYFSWQIDIYTDNFETAPDTTTWGYQYGGLIGSADGGYRLPLSWLVSDSTVSISKVGEPDEFIKNTVNGSTTTISAPWTYVKDKRDKDNPGTDVWKEDWNSAWESGYTTVLLRGYDCLSLPYSGTSAVSPVVVYLEGEFLYIEGKMHYESTIFFDLLFQ